MIVLVCFISGRWQWLAEVHATDVSGVFTEGVSHSLLKDKRRDEVPDDLAALKDQEKYSKIARHDRVLGFMVELSITDSCGGQVSAF